MFTFMQDTRFFLWNFYAHDEPNSQFCASGFVGGVKQHGKNRAFRAGAWCELLALVAPYNGYIELGLIPGQFLPRLITYQIRPA